MSTSVGTESEAQATGKTGGWLAVEVSRHVSAPLAHVWEVLVSPEGSSALLGDGAVLGGKGEPYHCVDGTSGVLRSFHPLEQIRVSFHETPDSTPSIVEVDLRADGQATRVDLRHDRIADEQRRTALERRWSGGLEALASAAAD
jgi:uncharacterized protein YndB with AHSA1/START domain